MEGMEGIAELTGKLPSWKVLEWVEVDWHYAPMLGKTGVGAVKDGQRSQVSGQVPSQRG